MNEKATSEKPSSLALSYGREEIRKGLFQTLAEELKDNNLVQPLSDDERASSLNDFLKKRPRTADEIWVFAYGSLIWNPGFHFIQQEKAVIHGFHRRFCLKAFVGRGCSQNPGLLLGLDQGGSCLGLGYHIHEAIIAEELKILWDREMMGGSYRPHWVQSRLKNGKSIPMISFVIRKNTNRFFPKAPIEEIAAKINQANGSLGSCRDYVYNTQKALKDYAISDRMIDQVADHLRRVEAR